MLDAVAYDCLYSLAKMGRPTIGAPFMSRRVVSTLARFVTMRASATSANSSEPPAFAIDGRSESHPASDRSKPISVRYSGSSVSRTHAAQLMQKKLKVMLQTCAESSSDFHRINRGFPSPLLDSVKRFRSAAPTHRLVLGDDEPKVTSSTKQGTASSDGTQKAERQPQERQRYELSGYATKTPCPQHCIAQQRVLHAQASATHSPCSSPHSRNNWPDYTPSVAPMRL